MTKVNTKGTRGANSRAKQPQSTPGAQENLAAQLWRTRAETECAYFSALCWAIADATLEKLDRLRPSDFKHPISRKLCEAAQTLRGRGVVISAENLAAECGRCANHADRQTDVAEWENACEATSAISAVNGDADEVATRLSHQIAPHSAEDWGEVLPLKNALYPVSPLPDVLIPAPLRDWVFDCAERVSVAPDYIAVAALVSLASIAGNTISIRPKQRDDWRVVPNLWGAAVGSPSVKKSPAIGEALKPLARLRAAAIEAHEKALKEWEADNMIGEVSKDSLKADLKTAKKNNASREEMRALIADCEDENPRPELQTYSVQDATIEALTGVLSRTPRGLLIQRDELTGWLRALDKQGHEQDRAFFLEAFAGTETNIQIERVGRGTVILPHCTLSILGTIQPKPFAALIRGSSADGGADGFVARFQMLVYPDAVPYSHVDRWPNTDARNRAFAIFETLDAMKPDEAGAKCDEGEAPYLRFDAEAQAIFDEWIVTLETRLPTLGDLIEQHLAKYRSLMPSLALLFHLVAVADGTATAGAVSADAAMMAVEWCEFLEQHARRIYAMAGDGATDGAELIAARLGQLPNPFTSRDVHQKGWAGLSNKADVDSALARLQERGWLRSQTEATGGAPKENFWKHPAKSNAK